MRGPRRLGLPSLDYATEESGLGSAGQLFDVYQVDLLEPVWRHKDGSDLVFHQVRQPVPGKVPANSLRYHACIPAHGMQREDEPVRVCRIVRLGQLEDVPPLLRVDRQRVVPGGHERRTARVHGAACRRLRGENAGRKERGGREEGGERVHV